MIRVLHYDMSEVFMPRKFFKEVMFKTPEEKGFEYELVEDISIKELEDILSQNNHDVLLIHPGLENQRKVIEEYPKRFPQLKIGLISYLPEDYEQGQVRAFSYDRVNSVIEFILSTP
nr:hypothetical protein [Nanoarchaeum sp.]